MTPLFRPIPRLALICLLVLAHPTTAPPMMLSSSVMPQLATACAAAATDKSQSLRKVRRRPLEFASAAKEEQYRAEMDHVQRYICAQVGGLDEHASQLLGVHDSRSRGYYEEIQEFLERKHELEHARTQTVNADRVLIRSLDEYLNELDPSLFAESVQSMPKGPAVANLPTSSSYIRRKQEEAMLARLWHKYQAAESDRRMMNALPCGGAPLKRQRVM